MPIPEAVIVAWWIEYMDWPGLDHVPILQLRVERLRKGQSHLNHKNQEWCRGIPQGKIKACRPEEGAWVLGRWKSQLQFVWWQAWWASDWLCCLLIPWDLHPLHYEFCGSQEPWRPVSGSQLCFLWAVWSWTEELNLSGSQFTHLANGDDTNIPSLQSCEYPME